MPIICIASALPNTSTATTRVYSIDRKTGHNSANMGRGATSQRGGERETGVKVGWRRHIHTSLEKVLADVIW